MNDCSRWVIWRGPPAARILDSSARYSAEEIASLAFDGPSPDVHSLAARWQNALATAADVVDRLPVSHTGQAVMSTGGRLFTGTPGELEAALTSDRLWFHHGRLGGALPQIKGTL